MGHIYGVACPTVMRSSFSSPARLQGERCSRVLEFPPMPAEQRRYSGAFRSNPLYSSSTKYKANRTLSIPKTTTAFISYCSILSEILSRKAPTISPTPKFLIVSAKNLRLMDFILPGHRAKEVRTGHVYGVARPALRSRYLATKNSAHTLRDAMTASRRTSLIGIHYKPQQDISNSDKGKGKLFLERYSIGQSQHERSHYQAYTEVSHLVSQELLAHTQIKPQGGATGKVSLPLPLFYLCVLLFAVVVILAVGLLEENRELREELSKWEALKLHTAPPSKARFYHTKGR